MRQLAQRLTGFLVALGIVAFFIAAGAIDASAQVEETVTISFTGSDFYIPRPAEATDQEGVERLLASYDLTANGYEDLVGETCLLGGTSANGESVHLNNKGLLRSNGDEVDILGTEDTASGVRLSSKEIVLGVTIDLYNIMNPDADGTVATSVDYIVSVTCTATVVTTTTSSTIPSSTTSSSTTTTLQITTTTTTGSSSTTGPVTTTSVPTDSTTVPDDDESTTTTLPPVTGSTLPFTGIPAHLVGATAMAATAAILLGGGVLLAMREN